MQTIAVGWQVYALTRDPLQLGYVGLVQFLPAIGLAPITGEAADRFERRLLLCLSSLMFATGALLLWVLSLQQSTPLSGIYASVALIGAARAISGPAGSALLPNLVPIDHFPNAVTWGGSFFQLAFVLGPALGGLVYGYGGGATPVYACTTVLEVCAAALYFTLHSRNRGGGSTGSYLSRLGAGIVYTWQHKVILGALSLDLFAVLFGGAVALLPVFARDVLQVGPTGLGWLRSAPAVGALLLALVIAYRPIERGAGKVLLGCVATFGLCMIGFGLSRSFALSLLLLTIAGAVDMVSVVMRHTLIQVSTPDAMRGRVGAVSLVFVGASNELGEFESGLTASLLGTVPSVVLGGAATLLVVLIWAFLFPSLRRVDSLVHSH